jgi:hypothetical protein
MTSRKFPCSSLCRVPIACVDIDMKKLLLSFLLFFDAMWGLEQISLPTIIAGNGLAMALMGVLHIAVTTENY